MKVSPKEFFVILKEVPNYTIVILLQIFSNISSFVGLPLLVPILDMLKSPDQLLTQNGLLNKYILSLLASIDVQPSFSALLIIVSVLILFSQTIQSAANLSATLAQIQLNAKYRLKLLELYQDSKWSWLNESRSGDISFAIIKETDHGTLCNLYALRILMNFLQLMTFLILSFILSWKSSIIAIIVFGVIGIFSKYNSKKILQLANNYHKNFNFLSNILSNVQTNKKFLKTNNQDGPYYQTLSHSINSLNLIDSSQSKRLLLQNYFSTIVGFLFLISLMYFHELLNLTYAKLTVILFIFFRIAPLFNTLNDCVATFLSNYPYYKNYKNRIKDLRQNHEHNGVKDFIFTENISFNNVSFTNSNKTIFKNLNLVLNPNKIYALIGKSGVGKTTLIDLIIGLWKPDEGTITYGQISHEEINVKSLRSKTAYVNQEVTLFYGTLKENITQGNISLEKNLDEAIKLSGLSEVVKNLQSGLDENIGENGSKLSGGQRQRISLARALVQKPHLLILDEATSALDNETEKIFQEALNTLRGKMSIILISHKLSSLQKVDEIILIKSEREIIVGNYEKLSSESMDFKKIL